MIDKKRTLIQFIKEKSGRSPIQDIDKQNFWRAWYEGRDDFYRYEILWNGRKKMVDRLSLNMLSKICEDWAGLLINKNTDIIYNQDNKNKTLQEALIRNNFTARTQEYIERFFAIGTGAIIVGRDADQKAQLSYVDGTRCYILKTVNGLVTSAAFIVDFPSAKKGAKLVSIHHDNHVVKNYVLSKDGIQIANRGRNYEVAEEEVYKYRTFVFNKPAKSRRDNWTTQFGQSIFANAVDANKFVDSTFDSYWNEYVLGRKRLFVSYDLMQWKKKNSDSSNPTPVFDAREAIFNMMPELTDAEKKGDINDKIKEVNMTIRQGEHALGIQDGLNYLSFSCGLGNNYYRFDKGSIATATQVISENSDLYRNIQKQKDAITLPLKELAVMILNIETGLEHSVNDITVTFDDSIFIDESAEKAEDEREVAMGVMSKVEFRMKWHGETEEEAKKHIADIEPIDLGG